MPYRTARQTIQLTTMSCEADMIKMIAWGALYIIHISSYKIAWGALYITHISSYIAWGALYITHISSYKWVGIRIYGDAAPAQ